MREYKRSSPGSRSRETVKIFKATKNAIDNLESKLQKEFERRARKLDIKVSRGTHGNVPTKAEAVVLFHTAWKRMAEPERTQMIKDCVERLLSDYAGADNVG